MGAILALNCVLILLFGFLGAWFSSRRLESSLLGFVIFAWWGFGLSLIGWGIYAAFHFISKYW